MDRLCSELQSVGTPLFDVSFPFPSPPGDLGILVRPGRVRRCQHGRGDTAPWESRYIASPYPLTHSQERAPPQAARVRPRHRHVRLSGREAGGPGWVVSARRHGNPPGSPSDSSTVELIHLEGPRVPPGDGLTARALNGAADYPLRWRD
ncbi:hypothetical protein AAFF_G00047730 [Aldrovandia affinis]|uniref:Uncharacterized protein n=1 Tax=Aldrovandia affinis TaxID=143900 RepID=A0AAD7S1R6_9TELE|nr:hypothetical protein AAFF_G00047730 [Aldrovandia affinis]